MTRIALIAAAVVALQSPAFAETGHDTQAAPLPIHVAAGIAELRQYGTRFEKVISAVEAEAAKPSWGWAEEDCSHTGDDIVLPSM